MRSADSFTGESIHFDLQANHPHISTWQCELHNRVLKGRLSKPCRITLPPRLRNRLNIPETSKWLSFMYPSEETLEIPSMQKPQNERADRLVQVIATAGAFVYFSEQDISQGLDQFDLKLDAVASCGCPDASDCYAPAVEFNFQQWMPFASITGLEDDVIKELETHAVEVTFPPLVQAGMSKFMWVSPSEKFYSNSFQHGGFMYYFKDGSPPVILPLGESYRVHKKEESAFKTSAEAKLNLDDSDITFPVNQEDGMEFHDNELIEFGVPTMSHGEIENEREHDSCFSPVG